MEALHQLLGADRAAFGTSNVDEVDSASAIETTHQVDLADAQWTVAVVPGGEFGIGLFRGCVHLLVSVRLLGRALGRTRTGHAMSAAPGRALERAPTGHAILAAPGRARLGDSPCGTVPGHQS